MGEKFPAKNFKFFAAARRFISGLIEKNDKRQRVLFFAPLPIGITFMTILLLEIISCGKVLRTSTTKKLT